MRLGHNLMATLGLWLGVSMPCTVAAMPLEQSSVMNVPLSHYALRSWNTRDGLPHNSINRISQGPDGYLWLATWEGPVRYNGRQFKNYEDNQITKFEESGVLSVRLDPYSNNLVFTGPRGLISSFDGQQWTPTDVGESYVYDVAFTANGDRWLAAGDGVYRVTAKQEVIHYDNTHGLPHHFTFRIVTTPEREGQPSQIFAGTRNGLAYYDPDADRFVMVQSVSQSQIRAFTVLRNGTLLVANDDGLYYQRAGASTFKPWPKSFRDRITALLEGADGCLLIGTFTQGLGRICQDSEDWLTTSNGLTNSHVLDIFRDKDGIIWIGTHGGLVQLRETLFNSYTQHHGLKGDYVRAVAMSPSGELWVGTNDGISRQLHQGKMSDFIAVDDHPFLQSISVLSIAHHNDGTVLVGTYTDGVLKLDGERIIGHLNTNTLGFDSNEIRSLVSVGDDIVLIGTASGMYVVRSTITQPFEIIAHYSQANGLASNFIASITVAPDGGLWLGSTFSLTYLTPIGPYQWQPHPVALDTFTDARNFFSGIATAERVWFATERGIVTGTIEGTDWRWLSRQDGLPFDKLFTINFDQQHGLWLGGPQGIIWIAQQQWQQWLQDSSHLISYRRFSELDGMVSRLITSGGPASTIDRHGRLWFATGQGVVSIQPEQAKEYALVPPQPIIEQVLLDSGPLSLLTGLIPKENTRTEFHYVSLGYDMPEALEYQVRLVGYDQQWINRANDLQSSYTSLAPGDYEFQVRSRYPDGVWSPYTQLRMVKEAYVYQRPWFWLVLAASVLAGLGLITQLRIRALEASRVQLRQLVQEQTRELAALAMQDSLTGLANRRAFDQRLEKELMMSRRYHTPLTIALLDLDHFKKINDTYLHTGGDIILKEVALQIKGQVRDVDIVARWGGEEFAVIFPNTTLAEALSVLQRLQSVIERMRIAAYPNARVTVSIGVKQCIAMESSAELLKAADRALYQAKKQGRNRIICG